MVRPDDPPLRERLSPAARREIKALSGARPRHFAAAAGLAWATIILCVAAARWSGNPVAAAAAIVVVATRQNVLGLLIHEQAHHLGLNFRHGDWLANALCGYPLLGLSVENYARIHLTHHRRYFTRDDPDFVRKNGPEWCFPMPASRLALLFLRDLAGLSLLQNIRGKNAAAGDASLRRRHPTSAWFKAGYFVVLAAVLTAVGGWSVFLLYWVLPLATVLQAIVRWGALCEHRYGIEGASVDDTSPVILPHWWERLILPNLNFTLHPYHHHFPAVAFPNLPRLHAIFAREELVRSDQVFDGYAAYLRHLLAGSRAASRDRPAPAKLAET
jgi:fatty acid desaturase